MEYAKITRKDIKDLIVFMVGGPIIVLTTIFILAKTAWGV